jgi:hypothetical protein
MSSGLGSLQKQILETLKNHNSIVFQRTLLWQIACDRDEIEITGQLCPDIETGKLKKSFMENFRRAVQRLGETGRIEIKDERLTSLEVAFEYFPNQTSDLEIYHLRKRLLPTVRDYIIEKKPKRFWHSEIEENQISKIRKAEQFTKARRNWKRIQKEIISILDSRDTHMFDHWLQCLIRGRYLFVKRSISHSKPLVSIYTVLQNEQDKTPKELDVLSKLKELMVAVFDKTDWKIGELKGIYYKIANFQTGRSDSLDSEVKRYLYERHRKLITSLPGHKEPPTLENCESKFGKVSRIPYRFRDEIRYSKYLDKLLTKQILKHQRMIKAI